MYIERKSLSKFLKQLGKREILTPHLDRWFEKYQPEVDPFFLPIQIAKPKDGYFHPSSHCVGCARTIFRAFDPHFKDEPDGRKWNNKVAVNGHLWHALLEHVIVEELGFCDTAELEVYAHRMDDQVIANLSDSNKHAGFLKDARWTAKGSLDLPWVLVPGQEKAFVCDIKTMNPSEFAKATPQEYLWNKYQAQAQIYMDWVDLDKAILLCVQAGNPFDFKEIVIDRDPEVAEYIYQKWDTIADAIASGDPPPHSCANPSECASLEWYEDTSV